MSRKSVRAIADQQVRSSPFVSKMKQLGFSAEGSMTFEEAMICSQIANAIKGDSKSFTAVMEQLNDRGSENPIEAFLDDNMLLEEVEEMYGEEKE